MHPYKHSGDNDHLVVGAAANGDLDQMRSLLNQDHDVHVKGEFGETALHWAAARGDEDMARVLIGAGAFATSTDDHSQTSLDVAREFRQRPLIKLLEQRVSYEQDTHIKKLDDPKARTSTDWIGHKGRGHAR